MSGFRLRPDLSTVLALCAGAVLRLWFIHTSPPLQGDPLLYGAIAKSWLQHGVYGFSAGISNHGPLYYPTLIRLPGYPAFLALCFRLFGVENYHAVLYVQAAADLCTCLLVSAFVRRVCSSRAAQVALWVAALCPFTANYVAIPLTETLSIFCVALGFYAFVCVMETPRSFSIAALIFSWSFAALLRPDGVLLGIVLFAGLIVYGWHSGVRANPVRLALFCALIALLPFVPWTWRNWHTFHVIEPLAPRTATDPGEFAAPGFERWTKTWLIDFASTYEIYWNVPGDKANIEAMPSRAFDNQAQYGRTRFLFDQYNRNQTLTPKLDAGFDALASEREQSHPWRTFLELPLLRLSDMWLRPRVEMLDVPLRWWQYSRHPAQTHFAIAYGLLNLAYILAAFAGFLYWPRFRAPMAAYIILRCFVLLVLAAPEPRYTLECFPILEAFAAQALLCVWDAGRRIAAAGTLRPLPISRSS